MCSDLRGNTYKSLERRVEVLRSEPRGGSGKTGMSDETRGVSLSRPAFWRPETEAASFWMELWMELWGGVFAAFLAA